MNKQSYPLKLPASIKTTAQRLAREDGVSLNQWISVAVAEKIDSQHCGDRDAEEDPAPQRYVEVDEVLA